MRTVGTIAGLAVIVLVVLAIADVATNPPPSGSASCDLDRQIVLPDQCVCSAAPRPGCPAATTRPYLFFFTQAATCALGCIILP